MTDSRQQPPPRRARRFLDRALSASAGIVALSALAVSVYQTKIMREQQRASAWPYVRVGHNWDQPGHGYSIHVGNDGLGPAAVRAVQVRVDGVARPNWNAVVRALLGRDTRAYFSTFHRGSVLLPGTDRPIVQLPVDSEALAFWREAQRPIASDTSHERLEIEACYCSLYEECWRITSESEEPERVRACEPPRAPWTN